MYLSRGGNLNTEENSQKNDILLKYKNTRSDDIKEILDLIDKIQYKEIRQSESYYPIRFFSDGVHAYLNLFDNAVLYYTGMAVEIGLLIKLKPLIETELKSKGKTKFTPNFKWLIDHSQSSLNKDLREKAHFVRIIRNCYIHYENIVAHTAWMEQIDWLDIVNRVKTEYRNNPEIIEKVDLLSKWSEEDRKKKGMFSIRFDFLELNKETMPFIEKRYKEYLEWLPQFRSVKKNAMTDKEFRNVYHIEVFDALSCLKCSFKILRGLKYL
jgi:hypothetical protein